MTRLLTFKAAGALLLWSLGPVVSAEEREPADWLSRYNVVYNTPARDFHDAMPIGNGDIGASVWVEEGGDLLFYLSKTDAYDENGRLLKLSRVRLAFTPNPFSKGLPFRQELRLRQGEIEIRAGEDASAVVCRLRVDANHPVLRVETESPRLLVLRVSLEPWRTRERDITSELTHSDLLRGSGQPTIQTPDQILPDRTNDIVWFYCNAKSAWPITMKLQGLEEFAKGAPDPLLERTFGGMIVGDGLVCDGATSLRSEPRAKHSVAVYAFTKHPASPREWMEELTNKVVPGVAAVGPATARAAHAKWWDEFWNRSWIRVDTMTLPSTKNATNTLPLRIGADANGATRFTGRMGRVGLWSRALKAEEVAKLAASREAVPPADPALVGLWRFDRVSDGPFANAVTGGPAAKGVGELTAADGGVAWTGKGFAEVAHDPKLDLASGFTLEAWIKPDAFGPGGARIINKVPVGVDNGYLLDTWPGNSLRLITSVGTLKHDAHLASGQWVHVAATFEAEGGALGLYVNGKLVATQETGGAAGGAAALTRGYLLQRYLMACGARGPGWVKFNGSIFTLPWEKADPDYRRWGPAQWFQNGRLAYWPLLGSGDYEMLVPFYRTYLAALPLALARTRLYYGHDGAFFPETLYSWGTYANGDYGWDRKGLAVGYATNSYIHYYWSGGLELSTLMLDHYAHTGDRAFLTGTVLPLAGAIVAFYDRHWKRDAQGKLRMEPAQSLETWQAVVNPLPDIAGLKFVLGELLALPEDATSATQREAWKRLLGELPPVPTREVDGKKVLAAAEKILQGASNSENPELYAVFPYRLYGVGRPDLEMARETLARRTNRQHICWWQDDIQMACLGLADDAGRNVAARLTAWNKAFRFPAMWGPHNDELPDMDHGGVGQMALQYMLLQAEGRKLYVLPAWPKTWDVEFKLHAPLNTTVEGVYRGGKLERLDVAPASRTADVTVMLGK